MRRRQFITLIGGAAAAWPLAAHAQQAGKTHKIGWLAFERRYAENRPERLPELAAAGFAFDPPQLSQSI